MTDVLRHPWDEAARDRIRAALQGGAVLTYPTETSYALGGNALRADLVDAVYALKGRPASKAMPLLVDASAGVGDWVQNLTPAAESLMAAFWPGPLTLVFLAGGRLPEHLSDARGTVALRWSPHPLLTELLQVGGDPLIGTSANLSGAAPLHSVDAVLEAFPQGIDLALDGGRTQGEPPSTLVDTTVDPPRLLREGAIGRDALRAVVSELDAG